MAKQRNATCPNGLFSATETKQPTPLRYPKSTRSMWLAECLGLEGRVGSPVISNPTDLHGTTRSRGELPK